jgi:hypothetical protein
MTREIALKHEFVEFIPEVLKEGTIYVSIRFATVSHLCCCGCRNKVVTPLQPTDWKLIFDGKSISLNPSIGNWNFPCRSHYWIRNNRVIWAGQWSKEKIEAARAHDEWVKDRYYSTLNAADDVPPPQKPLSAKTARPEKGFLRELKKFFSR